MSVTPGQVLLERYVVDRQLGEGGMGKVYLGRHVRLGVPAALKVLTAVGMPGIVERFEREAMLMAKVRHPNVVAILDYGLLADGSPCIAMEYAEGVALDACLKRKGALPLPDAVSYTIGILSGVAALHAESVLHRDLKPANVMITRGRAEMVKLIDFGIALPSGDDEQRLTRTGSVVGTPAYMSPEQLMCYPMDRRSDLYSAGLILYEMLTGALPFPGKNLSQVMRRLRDPLPRPSAPSHLPSVPTEVLRVLGSALSLEADRRPVDAEAFISVLIPFAGDSTAAFRETPQAPPHDSDGRGTAETVMADLTDLEELAKMGIEATGAEGSKQPTGRFLLGARLAPSRLASPADRKWLAAVAGREARAYAFGGRFWFALQSRPTAEAEARAAASKIELNLKERYGSTARVQSVIVAADFRLSPSALTGAAPMPPELSHLLSQLES